MEVQVKARIDSAERLRLKRKRKWIEHLTAYAFVGPMAIGVFIISFLPILASLGLSFTEWNFIAGWAGLEFVGFDNFVKLTTDDVFLKSVKNNLIFLLTIPVTMAVSLTIAVVINRYVYFKGFFKVIYFMPYISSIVAVAIVWQIIFHPTLGPLNHLLVMLGVSNPPKWIADIHYALPSIMLIYIWVAIGFNLIVYLAGLQSIPKDLYEAADIDGAGGWKKFCNITFPMLSPTSFFLLVTGIISSFKVFDMIQVLTGGGPAYSTSVMVYYLYQTAFVFLKIGYASSMAFVLFLCVLAITALQWYGQRKWVNY